MACALHFELCATRARLYDALGHMLPMVRSGHLPPAMLFPPKTEMPSRVAWPEVEGYTPSCVALLPPFIGPGPCPCPYATQGLRLVTF